MRRFNRMGPEVRTALVGELVRTTRENTGVAQPRRCKYLRRGVTRTASLPVPWLVIGFMFAAGGWCAAGYLWSMDYAKLQQAKHEQEKVALEQQTLAEQRARLLAERELWELKELERARRLQALAEKQEARLRAAMSQGNFTVSAVDILHIAEEIGDADYTDSATIQRFAECVGELFHMAQSATVAGATQE